MPEPAAADARDRFNLYWLPPPAADWTGRLKAAEALADADARWQALRELAGTRMDFVRTGRIDRALQRLASPPAGETVRLAVLGSSTTTQLLPALRVAGLRRGLQVRTWECDYGQYQEAAHDPRLAAFAPTDVLVALDARHLTRVITPGLDAGEVARELEALLENLRRLWRELRERHGATIVQQAVLPLFAPLLGQNEQRLPAARAEVVARFNVALRALADAERVQLLALDREAAVDGVRRWHDDSLWHRAKQEVSPAAAPLYGELVLRLLAAVRGRASKCVVLDLDNTLWGGVVGDDGLEGIVLGQGSGEGEAYVAFQQQVRDLAQRGVIVAVCSKNDDAVARAVFDRHPDMLLRPADIACFVANWDDKAANLQAIARRLDIGLDALVFVDDNPFERNRVRAALPMVAVPELPEDPAYYGACLADGGYFESVGVTHEDRERTALYQANAARSALQAQSADLPSYLQSLDMRLLWSRFDRLGLKRITQLINKTNQFNLTTRRYTEEQVLAAMDDPQVLGLQLRLVDRFGDNGMIGVVIGRLQERTLHLDTWLMSCRVLGRGVEAATLDVLVAQARALGAEHLAGEYIPTAKNAMVAGHYPALGFAAVASTGGEVRRWKLALRDYQPRGHAITLVAAADASLPA